MLMKTLLITSLLLSLFTANFVQAQVTGDEEKKKSVVVARAANNEEREYLDTVKSPKVTNDEGTNDPLNSGFTLIYIDGKAVYTKSNVVNGTTITITYTPK